jgi:hypothetical protein
MRIRKSLSISSIIVIALTGVTLAENSASATTGGGCGPRSYDVQACVSAKGDHVEPDLYVTNSTGLCEAFSYTLWDYTADRAVYAKEYYGCLALGHYYPGPIIGVNGHHYRSYVIERLVTDEGISSVSPELIFSN